MYGQFPLRCVGQDRVEVIGGFVTVGSGNPATLYGEGFTVVRTAAGRYTVTLNDPAPAKILALIPAIAPATIATELVANEDPAQRTTSVFEIRVANLAGALVDDAGSIVSFIAGCSTTLLDA